ncbi:MocR family transcriptional regulator [Cupriavidus basilensis OR16]|uniref:MocR family transcriptional regulator n=1 Tax=Cupriavidus basilensis OR16 TaxID=1127483 RepID=H1SCC0_9BURK|nr:PLP-dependent aminotransferase family protein [Cupriavidus basilensis]EHP39898.1 MocR family transcriptional regulator [Cupriavidus basilensis OR16]
MKRYEELAETLAKDIRNGNLPPGTKMPSIRKTVIQYGVSPATAFQAYYRLEERGLVRARERSGYYVTGQVGRPLPQPAARPSHQVSTDVDISKLVFSVLDAARDPQLIQLGSAFPSPELFPWERLGKPLIEDDVYGELYFGDRCPLPAKAFDQEGLVMHCSSFSKTLAPGFRVGWVAPGQYGEAIKRLRLMTTLSAGVPTQVALAEYLQNGGYDKHLRRLRHLLEMQQGQLIAAIGRHFPDNVRVSQPAGGYFLWVEFAAGFDALALHRAALEQGIGIAPGPIFSARQGYRNCIRLNYGHLWSDAVEAAVAKLGQLAKAQLQ